MILSMKKHYALYIIIGALFTINLNAQKVDLYEGLISNYDFKGNADDKSGNGNHGVLYGPVLSQDRFGSSDNAYFFDGVDDFIEINPVSDVSNMGDFSIAVWINCYGWERQPGIVNGVLDYQYIFDSHSNSKTVTSDFLRDGFSVVYKLDDSNLEYLTNLTKDISASTFITNIFLGSNILNNWHHIVFSRKDSNTNHYVDGFLVETGTVNSSLLNMQHYWFIGTFSGNNPNYNRLNYNFYGIIDDMHFYNRAINACEVEALYSGNFPPER